MTGNDRHDHAALVVIGAAFGLYYGAGGYPSNALFAGVVAVGGVLASEFGWSAC